MFSQITVLFKASDNIPVSWSAEPSVYFLHASHCIQPPFNCRARHNSVFPHHTPSTLRPSFNDETSAPGCLGICFIISVFVMEVCLYESRCVFVHSSFCIFLIFYFFSSFTFCSEAWNLMSWAWLCYFFVPHLRLQLYTNPLWLHLEP